MYVLHYTPKRAQELARGHEPEFPLIDGMPMIC